MCERDRSNSKTNQVATVAGAIVLLVLAGGVFFVSQVLAFGHAFNGGKNGMSEAILWLTRITALGLVIAAVVVSVRGFGGE